MNTVKLEKTSTGAVIPVSVLAKLASNRKLFLYGVIDNTKASDIVSTLLLLDSSPNKENITLFVSSYHASAQSILMICDCIELLKSPVKVICAGIVQDLSVLLLAVASEAKLTKNSMVCFDPLKLTPSMHKTGSAELLMKRAAEIEKRVYSIFAKKMKKPLKEIKEIFTKNLVWSPKEAIKNNLIDSIVTIN